MVLLTDLPPEILHNILRFVDPPDLARIPRICKTFNYSITGNAVLFREVYLAHFDAPPTDDIAWEQSLKDIVRLQSVCNQDGVENKKHELSFVYKTVTELLQNASSNGQRASRSATHASSLNAALLSTLFSNHENQLAFLERSFIFERARGELPPSAFSSPPKVEHQQSAKLHCLYGVPLLYVHRTPRETRQGRMAPFACSKVYDLRQYTTKTMWGPFMDDGSGKIDWEKVEAIMLVLGANLNRLGLTAFPICKNFWDTPFGGVWSNSYLPLPILERPKEDGELDDPYGITGTWLRVICFLDYADFFEFNFGNPSELPSNVPRRAITYDEATRLILMKITVCKIEPPGPEDGQALPVVHFKGYSRSLDDMWDENANSGLRGIEIKGTVRLTSEGEVRWTTFSLYNGEERWRSEGVQVGGVKSAKGVLGNWFDKDYDPRGPAGPSAFWKISDKISSGPNEHHAFLHQYSDIEIIDGDYVPDDEEVRESEDDEEGEVEDEDDDDDDEDGYNQDHDDLVDVEDVEIELIFGPGVDLAEIFGAH
ncbi:F-box domain-containing protein [Xylariales sp. PMI_506]|nr:F-box domain-containing protein [Xylariales sp. PMI_506]